MIGALFEPGLPIRIRLRNWLLLRLAGTNSVAINVIFDGKKGIVVDREKQKYSLLARCVVTNFVISGVSVVDGGVE